MRHPLLMAPYVKVFNSHMFIASIWIKLVFSFTDIHHLRVVLEVEVQKVQIQCRLRLVGNMVQYQLQVLWANEDMGSGELHTTFPTQLDMDATTVLWMVRHRFTLTITHPEEVLQVMKFNFLMLLSLVEPRSSNWKLVKRRGKTPWNSL